MIKVSIDVCCQYPWWELNLCFTLIYCLIKVTWDESSFSVCRPGQPVFTIALQFSDILRHVLKAPTLCALLENRLTALLTSSVIRRTATWNLFVYTIKEQTTTAFLFQNLSQLLESRPLPTSAITKKAIWGNLLSLQNEAISLVAMCSKELWLVHKNHVTVILDSKGSRGMKTYSEGRIELRNLQILKKMPEFQVSFCHQNSPVIRKAWMLPWILQELKEYVRKTCGFG